MIYYCQHQHARSDGAFVCCWVETDGKGKIKERYSSCSRRDGLLESKECHTFDQITRYNSTNANITGYTILTVNTKTGKTYRAGEDGRISRSPS
jgi:hypothetical protein